MSKQKKSELLFILICAVIALVAVFFLSGCSHVVKTSNPIHYYESGEIKSIDKITEDSYGVIFSDKSFSIIEIN